MSAFGRGLTKPDEEALLRMARDAEPNWFRDLLALWTPSGSPSGPSGLRLAVRNGYLNFYRRGQSVARVAVGRDGRPFAQTHVKYAYGPERIEQAYARLRDERIERRGLPTLPYEGPATLSGWIDAIEGGGSGAGSHRGWVGEEKDAVDQTIAGNPEIIDLEMGLPAEPGSRSAYRMDVVALERSPEGPRVVFWEAKLIADPRLRSRDKKTGALKVVNQLQQYARYVEDEGRRAAVGAAYAETCRLLVRLHSAAAEFGPAPQLDDIVRQAAASKGSLAVDPRPRLVVFDAGQASRALVEAVNALWAGGVRGVRRPAGDCRLTLAQT